MQTKKTLTGLALTIVLSIGFSPALATEQLLGTTDGD